MQVAQGFLAAIDIARRQSRQLVLAYAVTRNGAAHTRYLKGTKMTTQQSFAALGVPEPLVAALAARGITTPFPIQADTLPDTLAGRDVLGRGKTGSGKTWPSPSRWSPGWPARGAGRAPTGLILAPTRELATQIAAALEPLAAASSWG